MAVHRCQKYVTLQMAGRPSLIGECTRPEMPMNQPWTVLCICYSCSICQLDEYQWLTWTQYQHSNMTATTTCLA